MRVFYLTFEEEAHIIPKVLWLLQGQKWGVEINGLKHYGFWSEEQAQRAIKVKEIKQAYYP